MRDRSRQGTLKTYLISGEHTKMQKRYKENIKEKKQTTVTTTLSATASSRLQNISTIIQTICAFTAAKIPFNSIDKTEVRHTQFFLANLEMVGQFRNQQNMKLLIERGDLLFVCCFQLFL